jgi:glycosyltransferase involved in cell wall biosynthesis
VAVPTELAAGRLSVLMAVYAGDRAPWLAAALHSLADQTLAADEIVVVVDGPISSALSEVLDEMTSRLPIRRLDLAVNKGLSAALQAGLALCSGTLVARMDADDIAELDRFELQAAVLTGRPSLSVLGGYVAEFDADPAEPYAIRTVPSGEDRVAKVARWRSPVNHPSVMFRRADVLAVGGYTGFVGIEDYYLWGKLLADGRHIDNLPQVLVRQRAGAAQGRRRGGLGYARVEVALFRAFVRIGFLTRRQACVGLLLRLPVRLIPDRIRSWVYRRLLRRRVRS